VAGADAAAAAAAREFAAAIVGACDGRLGPRLKGAYLIGSLAHGGFSRRYSDIDVALVAEDGLSDAELGALRAEAAALAPDLAAKLSIFWGDRAFTIGRFPPLDRVDLIDHAAVLIQRERFRPPPPSVAEIRAYLRGTPFTAWAENARRLAAALTLEAKDRKPYLRALLYPARFVFSWRTGRMDSNDAAVAFLAAEAPPGFDLALIAD